MSEDSYRKCPKCGKDEDDDYERGTLREDYEFYADGDDDIVVASYSCHCPCGYGGSFKIRWNITEGRQEQ